jgi:UDP-2,4-diacetamido-2,4,6-trideoxy-beta-L-altropyranose hydrolase
MMSTNHKLLIRADASTEIGSGHLMRCLALAQAWQETGGGVCFALAWPAPALEARLQAEGMDVTHLTGVEAGSLADAEATIALAQQQTAAWIVLDGYHFDVAYQRQIKQAGLRLLFIDDYAHASHYYADIVLNQNIYAQAEMYASREPFTRLLLGTEYLLLRREFWAWRDWQRPIPDKARKILVTLGGSDPDNVTLTVIQALQHLPEDDWEAIVLVGGQNPHVQTLATAVAADPCIQLRQNAANMPDLMAWADIAVSAGGSSSWELCFMGVPTLLIVLADNQRPVAKGLANQGAAEELGWYASIQPTHITQSLQALLPDLDKRMQLSQTGHRLVNGDGARSVAMQLQGWSLILREVQADDCRLVWEWANDPVTRSNSFSSDMIAWDEHVAWFTTKLTDPRSYFYLAFNSQDQPVGYVRFQQIDDTEADISVAVAPEQRRRGYGTKLICQGVERLWQNTNISRINAYIKPDNLASRHIFAKAGFNEINQISIKNSPACHFIKHRQQGKHNATD